MENKEIYWSDFDCDGIEIIRHERIVAGSDYDFDENGVEVATEPEFEECWTLNDGSFLCDSREEIIRWIDKMLGEALERDALQEMEKTLNGIEVKDV